MPYDLLVGADGINSALRKMLVETKGLEEEHFLSPSKWKALRLPPQPDLDPGTFQPLVHPNITGAVLPRYPGGHTVLIFWREDGDNPAGIYSAEDLREAISSAVQKKLPRTNVIRRLTWSQNKDDNANKEINLVFDNDEVERFIRCKPGREHVLKIDRYHDQDSSVVLLGDSAHGMYSLLGQGCACGFESSLTLAKCLQDGDLPSSLQAYSKLAVPEGHAITDLNLISHVLFRNPIGKALAMPLVLAQALRGKMVISRVNDPVTYQEILKENQLLVSLARRSWKRKRIPFETQSGVDLVEQSAVVEKN